MNLENSNIALPLRSDKTIIPKNYGQVNVEVDLKSKNLSKNEKSLLHKYINEDPNLKRVSILEQFKAVKIPLVLTGGFGLVSLFMGRGLLSLILFSLGSLFVMAKIN